ncbi:MAG TPA: hypothetical protein VN924_29315 [Bryobacteraceae bacterium]|nr:hypothetical protein [Bryobacteraceae bacterium]
MNRVGWWLVDILSRTLEPDERDAVRGDFAESGESAGRALRDVIGLVVRRQAALWKDWRPWVAPVGLIAPVLCGGSGIAWIGWQFRTIRIYGVRYEVGLTLTDDVVRLACFSILAIAWAWSGGFVFGSLSRRTLRAHPALLIPLAWFCFAVLQALASSRLDGMLLWLLPPAILFLIPFLWGTRRGVRRGAFSTGTAVWLGAAAVTMLTFIVQVESSREGLAFAAWSGGGAMDGRLPWTPRLLPFAAIIWQFGLMSAAMRSKENNI